MREAIAASPKPSPIVVPSRWNVAGMSDSLGTFQCSCLTAGLPLELCSCRADHREDVREDDYGSQL